MNCFRNYFTKLSTFRKMDIRTFVFVDCETTGLPYQEYNRTKITEISFTVIESNHISLGVYPRVQNKLSLSFNPRKMIDPFATQITGLTNDLLEYQPAFDFEAVELMKSFLKAHKKPQCLVAHNGFNFDYPILRAEVVKSKNVLPDDLVCVDTLQMFRELHKEEAEREFFSSNDMAVESEVCVGGGEAQMRNETTPKKPKIVRFKSEEIDDLYFNPGMETASSSAVPTARKKLFPKVSFKLVDCYKRFTHKEPMDAHRAEVDVDMLVECAATLGQRFVDLSNQHCKLFYDIPAMTVGKKIGVQ